GEIYFLKFGGDGSGQVFKLSRTTSVIPDPPALLSQVGAFTDLTTLVTIPGLIPYDVNAPLWSDGAAKSRWVAVPTNNAGTGTILFSPTNDWQFPAGTVFVKHFELPLNETNPAVRTRLETRFLVRDASGGVYGVTYKWRPDGSDADLLTTAATNTYNLMAAGGLVRTQAWYFPGRLDCLACHNANAHGVLGLKTHQLNGNLTYPQTGQTDNQLRTWGHLGLFSGNFAEAKIGGYPHSWNLTNTTQSLVTRVRSYIDANCSHCHRPGGQRANFDARFTTPLEQQNLIYGPVFDNVNDATDRVIRPQDLVHSLMLNRASRVGTLQMPPIAKNLVDAKAMDLLTNWINSLSTGPGVFLSLTNPTALVAGPFLVNVTFTEPVAGINASQFLISNGQVSAVTGSGATYSVWITPGVKGAVTVQFGASQLTGNAGQPNYASNPLTVTYDPLNASLVTWLPFDEGLGSTAADASGYGNTGHLLNFLPTAWINGVNGNALYYDGISDYVQIANPITPGFTICCWINTTQQFPQVDPTYNGTGIIWADVGGAANDFILGGTRSAGGINRLSFFAGGSETTVSGVPPINTGQWVHLAVTRDASTGTIKLYVNGVLDGSGVGGTNLLNANAIVNIGGNTLDGHFFNGAIDDVRFYSRVLSASELGTLLPGAPPSVSLTTPKLLVTNMFTVTATFNNLVGGLTAAGILVQNGRVSSVSGNGGIYNFSVLPNAPGPVTLQLSAGAAYDANNNPSQASLPLVVTAVDPAIPLSGLAGCWNFDETNNTSALDTSGNGNHGLLQNLSNSNRVAGIWGSAMAFNGTNSYVSFTNTLGGSFSVSFWLQTTQSYQQTDNTFAGTGLFWADVSGAHNDYVLGATRSAAGLNRLSFFTGGPDSSMNGTKNIATGRWEHVAMTRNQLTGERRLYFNGLLDITSPGGTNLLLDNPRVSLGGNTLDGRYFQGKLDEVRAYNRVLSDAEVAALAGAGGYLTWAASALPNATAAQSSAAADPDGDGMPNLLEYAFDTNPGLAEASPFAISRNNGSVQLSYPRRTGFSGLAYAVYQSADMVHWAPLDSGAFSETTLPVTGRNLEIVTDRLMNLNQQAYFRIQVQAVGQ
ncbi:MAG TPA: LamG-like jellyroll fold domain-containing protein, partial [Verrucomicrobiae bacterium]